MAWRRFLLLFLLPGSAPALAATPPSPLKTAPACVPVDQIAGAIVTDDQNVDLHLKDGSRWQMRFAEPCPALGFYQGFYYRRAQASYLCAGLDAVVPRSGGECPIKSLTRTGKPKRK